jgi:hypothetical protein
MRRFLRFLTTALVSFGAVSVTAQATPGFLSKPTTQAIRLLTWNVYRDSIFPVGDQCVDAVDASRPAQFARVLRAVQPDVVALYMICAHFQSSDSREDISMRQRQAQLVVNTIRDARAGRRAVPLRPRTPFVILGDLNAIPGGAVFVDAVVSGQASPVPAAGRADGLDWDRSSLTDAQPRRHATAETAKVGRRLSHVVAGLEAIDLGLPGEDGFPIVTAGLHMTTLRLLEPMSSGGRVRPVRHEIFGAR